MHEEEKCEEGCEYLNHDPREAYRFTLSAEDFDFFVRTCENPPAPSQKLIDLMKGRE